MQAKFDALQTNDTWFLVPVPSNFKPIGCKYVYKVKLKPNGSLERHKALLVVKGYSQTTGLDYFETFSPMVKPTTIWIVFPLAMSKNWHVKQLDMRNAFLHGELGEYMFMVQPHSLVDSNNPFYVCKLQKALYGLK